MEKNSISKVLLKVTWWTFIVFPLLLIFQFLEKDLDVFQRKKSYTVCPLAEFLQEHSCYELSLITVIQVRLYSHTKFPALTWNKQLVTAHVAAQSPERNHSQNLHGCKHPLRQVSTSCTFISSLHSRCIPTSTSFSAAVSVPSLSENKDVIVLHL